MPTSTQIGPEVSGMQWSEISDSGAVSEASKEFTKGLSDSAKAQKTQGMDLEAAVIVARRYENPRRSDPYVGEEEREGVVLC